MEQNKINHQQVELRSEKVRNLINEIPPSLIRWGVAIMVIVFLSLMAVVFLFPYPYSCGESIIEHLLN